MCILNQCNRSEKFYVTKCKALMQKKGDNENNVVWEVELK